MFYISSRISSSFTKGFLVFILVSCFVTNSFTQEPAVKKDSAVKKDTVTNDPLAKKVPMLDQFCAINHEPLYWFSSKKDTKRAKEWIVAI